VKYIFFDVLGFGREMFSKLTFGSRLQFGNHWYRSMCLAIAGVANRSETKSHVSYCVTAKSHIIHKGTYEHNPISSSLTHTFVP